MGDGRWEMEKEDGVDCSGACCERGKKVEKRLAEVKLLLGAYGGDDYKYD